MIASPDLGSNPSSSDSSLSDLKPQLPDQMNEDKNIYFVELLGGLNRMMEIKHVEQCLAQSNCPACE